MRKMTPSRDFAVNRYHARILATLKTLPTIKGKSGGKYYILSKSTLTGIEKILANFEDQLSEMCSGCEWFGGEKRGEKVHIYLKSKEEAQAFVYFMEKERKRHLKDVENINRDLSEVINKWDVKIPDVDVKEWVVI
jgi:hypothetical protein